MEILLRGWDGGGIQLRGTARQFDAVHLGHDDVGQQEIEAGLLDFLEKYNNFIGQGEKYYQKFEVIVSNYQNETACAGQLPQQYATLKQDIKFSIEKFREAYNIAELTGSKLKDLLYGTSD